MSQNALGDGVSNDLFSDDDDAQENLLPPPDGVQLNARDDIQIRGVLFQRGMGVFLIAIAIALAYLTPQPE